MIPFDRVKFLEWKIRDANEQIEFAKKELLIIDPEYANQWQASREEWIEIKEGCEMPEECEDVYVYCDPFLGVAYKSGNGLWYESYNDGPSFKPTHWRKLPEAPKLNK